MTPAQFDVAVIGGGQAGLAMGFELKRRGMRFTILEAAAEPAAAWRQRWDSLTLFTPARYDGLPGLPFPGDPDRYPKRDEVVDYLAGYADHFGLPVELDSRVGSVRREGDRYVLALADRDVEARQVVVATGPFQVPFTPPLAADLAPGVTQLHSTEYRAPDALPGGPVLVVGGGNTGFQIAEELSATHDVHLAIGSRQMPLPQRLLGRDLFTWLDRTGLMRRTVDSRIGQRMKDRETLVGSTQRRLRRRHGVTLHPRATGAAGPSVRFADGTRLAPDTVIWATGFRPDHAWIDAPVLDAGGSVEHRRGVTASPGLYFLGLPWQHTRGSALLGWVKDDAAFLADRIAHTETTMTTFPTDPAGLEPSHAPETVELADGERYDLRIAPVTKEIGDAKVRMLAYNGSVPGPTLKVAQGSEIVVDVENQGDLEATVHWHGLRLDNRYDGTRETQKPMDVGEHFEYRLSFPDPGAYWYHPHVRQDYGQELGLYGAIVVVPPEPDYWPPAHRDLPVTLDDILLEDGKVAPFSREESTFAAMGRYGDHFLVNGEEQLALTASAGEVVRLYLTNTANSRVFDVRVRGGRMKLVGGDSGRVEHEEIVESVVLAPSERAVVDVLFESAGEAAIEHHSPSGVSTLATVAVDDRPVDRAVTDAFDTLRTNAEMVALREEIAPFRDRAPDKTVAFIAELDMMGGHDHHEGHGDGHDHHGMVHPNTRDGVEWEDDMVEMNRMTTTANTRWKVTGDTDWRFKVGDRVKIRLDNAQGSDHPMHHPFHIHGAGRFLVLSRDGVEDDNLVWTDTVLVRDGQVVDILLDVTHAGTWMAHCHIAEHHESGMMLNFEVTA